MVDVMQNHYANINRGVYLLSEEVTQMVEAASAKFAHQKVGLTHTVRDKDVVEFHTR
jgi:selenocysteine lyase/cysteine desulfurase